ncbi:MAG: phytanoyl-CoA dioxygenase family protein, partial [Bacteroidota bacterium]
DHPLIGLEPGRNALNPDIAQLIFSDKLKCILRKFFPNGYQVIKSIYFDKPPTANWIVNWHQDLTINLKEKKDVEGFKNWRVTAERVIVQPPVEFLERILTVRIHLDDCTKENGALRVIEGSHKKGIIPIKSWMKSKNGQERICEVGRGGVLLMNPLTLHASKRSENQKNRRVIHIEFTDQELPRGLDWKEALVVHS